ncbi:hypothetical protein CAOG_05093 [Capsaspora owczarzaki ATCC 30864]|uniref:BRCT domain-containing protein n=1 Tax=Capsaspora owczarzaki (strain ATCC 30864) TaxID=595528 RepID=A0A0D2WRE2_CAPO3|nr:hypothetical protein CAOG_05093 [Capsaspora owczarzaki ATCC 30864]KJE94455.1 hypothetical protein CAOG_005093 [Capsaspora owczarzaki ATCC 30864]|eukprot:XP_004346778.2 hypothetical protein CAOG_05093 [Capsaspora owczarzaki ATCC 30864]
MLSRSGTAASAAGSPQHVETPGLTTTSAATFSTSTSTTADTTTSTTTSSSVSLVDAEQMEPSPSPTPDVADPALQVATDDRWRLSASQKRRQEAWVKAAPSPVAAATASAAALAGSAKLPGRTGRPVATTTSGGPPPSVILALAAQQNTPSLEMDDWDTGNNDIAGDTSHGVDATFPPTLNDVQATTTTSAMPLEQHKQHAPLTNLQVMDDAPSIAATVHPAAAAAAAGQADPADRQHAPFDPSQLQFSTPTGFSVLQLQAVDEVAQPHQAGNEPAAQEEEEDLPHHRDPALSSQVDLFSRAAALAMGGSQPGASNPSSSTTSSSSSSSSRSATHNDAVNASLNPTSSTFIPGNAFLRPSEIPNAAAIGSAVEPLMDAGEEWPSTIATLPAPASGAVPTPLVVAGTFDDPDASRSTWLDAPIPRNAPVNQASVVIDHEPAAATPRNPEVSERAATAFAHHAPLGETNSFAVIPTVSLLDGSASRSTVSTDAGEKSTEFEPDIPPRMAAMRSPTFAAEGSANATFAVQHRGVVTSADLSSSSDLSASVGASSRDAAANPATANAPETRANVVDHSHSGAGTNPVPMQVETSVLPVDFVPESQHAPEPESDMFVLHYSASQSQTFPFPAFVDRSLPRARASSPPVFHVAEPMDVDAETTTSTAAVQPPAMADTTPMVEIVASAAPVIPTSPLPARENVPQTPPPPPPPAESTDAHIPSSPVILSLNAQSSLSPVREARSARQLPAHAATSETRPSLPHLRNVRGNARSSTSSDVVVLESQTTVNASLAAVVREQAVTPATLSPHQAKPVTPPSNPNPAPPPSSASAAPVVNVQRLISVAPSTEMPAFTSGVSDEQISAALATAALDGSLVKITTISTRHVTTRRIVRTFQTLPDGREILESELEVEEAPTVVEERHIVFCQPSQVVERLRPLNPADMLSGPMPNESGHDELVKRMTATPALPAMTMAPIPRRQPSVGLRSDTAPMVVVAPASRSPPVDAPALTLLPTISAATPMESSVVVVASPQTSSARPGGRPRLPSLPSETRARAVEPATTVSGGASLSKSSPGLAAAATSPAATSPAAPSGVAGTTTARLPTSAQVSSAEKFKVLPGKKQAGQSSKPGQQSGKKNGTDRAGPSTTDDDADERPILARTPTRTPTRNGALATSTVAAKSPAPGPQPCEQPSLDSLLMPEYAADDRVLARWKDGSFYAGTIARLLATSDSTNSMRRKRQGENDVQMVIVLFDDGDRLRVPVTALFPAAFLRGGQRVFARRNRSEDAFDLAIISKPVVAGTSFELVFESDKHKAVCGLADLVCEAEWLPVLARRLPHPSSITVTLPPRALSPVDFGPVSPVSSPPPMSFAATSAQTRKSIKRVHEDQGAATLSPVPMVKRLRPVVESVDEFAMEDDPPQQPVVVVAQAHSRPDRGTSTRAAASSATGLRNTHVRPSSDFEEPSALDTSIEVAPVRSRQAAALSSGARKQMPTSPATTPSRAAMRGFASNAETLFSGDSSAMPESDTLFLGFIFYLTCSVKNGDGSVVQKDALAEQIEAGGGHVMDTVFEADIEVSKGAFVVADTPRRTLKYLQALAIGSRKNAILDPKKYTLAAGLSLLTNQEIEYPIFKSKEHRPFHEQTVLIGGEAEFRSFWKKVLDAGGAKVSQRPPNAVHASESNATFLLLPSPATAPTPNDREISNLVRRANLHGIPAVTCEWIVQCLIVGRLIPPSSHPSFLRAEPRS